MKENNSQYDQSIWTIEDSSKIYNLNKWGGKYFSINSKGNILISPDGYKGKKIDLHMLVKEIKNRKINPPFILRFNDILKDRIKEINTCFSRAIKQYKYQNIYQGVFPVKCNHQKHLIEKIIEFGGEWNLGLEVGSKSELLIGLSLLKDTKSLLICNGYKDTNYIEMTILARKLGRQAVLVIEQRDEIQRIIESVKNLGSTPILGIRAKLSSKSSGRWSKSIGEKSKFGLSVPEILSTIKELKKADLLKELKLLHFHIGSQISDIKIIKDALQEASQLFVEISKLGAPLTFLDVGGGLGIDYDGSKTSSEHSTNYSLQNYANDVVATIKDSCDENKIREPIIISESGRSISSHCSIFVFNILGTSTANFEINVKDQENKSLIIKNLMDTYTQIKKITPKTKDLSKIIELWNDIKKFKDDCLTSFRLGFTTLPERAFAEQISCACAREISQRIEKEEMYHSDLSEIKDILSSTYYANFSIFKSTPDSWAINQVFPIIPIHRHLEEPIFKGNFADLTCDSDGKLNNFINNDQIKSLINLHGLIQGQDYYIGIFLSGAYQEALGNLHNLFGNTNIIHIDIDDNDNYQISKIIKEDSQADILTIFDYNPKDMIEIIRIESEIAIKNKNLTIVESQKLIAQIESSLRKSSYLSE